MRSLLVSPIFCVRKVRRRGSCKMMHKVAGTLSNSDLISSLSKCYPTLCTFLPDIPGCVCVCVCTYNTHIAKVLVFFCLILIEIPIFCILDKMLLVPICSLSQYLYIRNMFNVLQVPSILKLSGFLRGIYDKFYYILLWHIY